jgi:formylglycine-generating enzyme required for sulfatase activity
MTDDFDPYHRWLGIPPKYQPADHYRLLGLERFEDDPEVIVDAAERQMMHVRRYALGPKQVLSQTILNELAAAQACLMDPVQKARYDEGLRQLPEIPIAPAAVPPAPKLGKLHNAARPLWAVRELVAAVPDFVRQQITGQLYGLRFLVVGIPLVLALTALFFAFGLRGNRGAARTVLNGIDAGPAVAPVANAEPEPVLPPARPVVPRPPRMLAIADQDIDEGVVLRVRLDIDVDAPGDDVRFHLAPGFPAGMRLDESQRMIIWTPGESQGPGEHWITVVITIPGAESRELHESFRVRVREVNTAPSIAPIADQVAEPRQQMVVAVALRDEDLPRNELTLNLMDGPPGAAIDADGRFSWTPSNSHAGGTWPVRLVVRDDGEPPMAAEARFTIRVTPSTPPPLAMAPFDAAQARAHQAAWAHHLGQPVEVTNSIGMKLVLIPPGEFTRSWPDVDPGRRDAETQHRVRITNPYYLGLYEVTQGEYERVMGTNPSWFSRTGRDSNIVSGQDTNRFPVEAVSWEDAMEFSRRLSALPAEIGAGRMYRLPSEAEWEHAARAGAATVFPGGNTLSSSHANFRGPYPHGNALEGQSLRRTTNVGSFRANAWGLHDTAGNVWEWVWDVYDASEYQQFAGKTAVNPMGPVTGVTRVLRGGCWGTYEPFCGSAFRFCLGPEYRGGNCGFRLAFSSVNHVGQ